MNFPKDSIDSIMNSMDKRVLVIVKRRKEILRYCMHHFINILLTFSDMCVLNENSKNQLYNSTNDKIVKLDESFGHKPGKQ